MTPFVTMRRALSDEHLLGAVLGGDKVGSPGVSCSSPPRAPSPAAHKDDAAVSGDERQRLDLARMGRDVGQDDSAARQLRFAGLKVRERHAVRQPSHEQGTGPDSLARLHPRPGYEGRPASRLERAAFG